MHEIALAEGIMVTALNLARQQQRPVRRIMVKVGELQQIEVDILRDCLDAVRPSHEPLVADMQVQLDIEPAALSCRGCGHDFHFADLDTPPDAKQLEAIHFVPELAHSYVQCPQCGSPDFSIVAGRGVWLEEVELLDQIASREIS
ncbi:MAG: hydrogenase/urease maturation nickel metallochaperone HypA [bacterium]|nr:hydrogenase/urease maturation nickel metallochaperone HypA [bacterium]